MNAPLPLLEKANLKHSVKRIGNASRAILSSTDAFSPTGPHLHQHNFTPKQVETILVAQQDGQALMNVRYSSGYPAFTFSTAHGGQAQFGYNNGRHGAMFARDAAKVSTLFGLSPAHTLINQLIGPWHDIVQDTIVKQQWRDGSDEIDSAAWFAREMHQHYHLPKIIAELGVYGILGTWVITDEDGTVHGQWASLCQEYPSKDAELTAKIAACADYGRLFAPEGPLLSHYLFAQRQGVRPHDTPDTRELARWHRNQMRFLLNHTYALKQAEKIFWQHRTAVLNYTQKLIDQDEQGRTLPWKELLRQDEQFMQACMR